MHILKEDTVLIIKGNDRGKTGKVLKVFPRSSRIVVEGINFIKRHTRPSPANPQGGIVEREAPIHVSKVMLVCTKCGKGSRVRHLILQDERKSKVRECVNCGEVIPKSKEQ
ncbi:MAG: 50S ribosomal protein L24 [Candidatus Glassbacteria bacterium]